MAGGQSGGRLIIYCQIKVKRNIKGEGKTETEDFHFSFSVNPNSWRLKSTTWGNIKQCMYCDQLAPKQQRKTHSFFFSFWHANSLVFSVRSLYTSYVCFKSKRETLTSSNLLDKLVIGNNRPLEKLVLVIRHDLKCHTF